MAGWLCMKPPDTLTILYPQTALKAGKTSVLVCSGRSTVPRTKTIKVRLAVQSCKRCTCFTAASTETRTCTELQADTTFVKKSCNDQSNLIALLVRLVFLTFHPFRQLLFGS